MDLKQLINKEYGNIVQALQEFVRIPSVEAPPVDNLPFGREVDRALEYALNLGKEMGFKTRNVDHYAGEIECGEGDEVLGILVHVDIVPAGNDWTHPPFAAEIHDNRLYGRGSIDNKCSIIACLYAMKAIKDSGLPIRKKIRMILGTNEETRWEGIEYYLERNPQPSYSIVPDANFPVLQGEKGILNFELKYPIRENDSSFITGVKGGNAINAVPDTCRIMIRNTPDFRTKVEEHVTRNATSCHLTLQDDHLCVTFTGKSAHACTPEGGVNAIMLGMKLLDEICPADDPSRSFIDWYKNAIGSEYNGQSIGCGLFDEISGKLTLNVGLIDWDSDAATISVDVRYPITVQSNEVLDGIKKAIKDVPVDMKVIDQVDAIYLERDHFLIQTLMDIYQKETGDLETEPIIIGGGTYARAMKNAVAFGPEFPGDPFLAHMKNEYVDLDRLKQCCDIYTLALYELSK